MHSIDIVTFFEITSGGYYIFWRTTVFFHFVTRCVTSFMTRSKCLAVGDRQKKKYIWIVKPREVVKWRNNGLRHTL